MIKSMKKKKILILLGTRPEAIKLAPVINELKSEKKFVTYICSTGQHKEMLQQVFEIFDIRPDINLELMKSNQDLFDITANVTLKLKSVIQKINPDFLMVQGDTSTAFLAALSAFYLKIPVIHIEAGLRSYNIYNPFPEEVNRKCISVVSSFHFAPTLESKKNLLSEGINKNRIWVTGNTVIDALLSVKKNLQLSQVRKKIKNKFNDDLLQIVDNRKFLLVTMHRREKFGKEFQDVLVTIRGLAEKYSDYYFLYPVHLNPNVYDPVHKILGKIKNIILFPPLDYLSFIYLMDKCFFIISDSGGVQEEAFVFNKPVIVTRTITERNEAVKAGYAFLVGSDDKKLTKMFNRINKLLLQNHNFFKGKNPFGDGRAAEKIVSIMAKKFY